MARIRTIKPDFWSSEQVMDCSPMARLLFIGLWNFCDDGGNHTASARTIKAEIFPGDDISSPDVQLLLDELSSNGLLALYTHDNKDYLHVTGWHHQKIDKPTFKHPSYIPEKSEPPRRIVDDSSPPEGKGREGNTTLSGNPDDPPDNPKKETARSVLEYLNSKAGKAYRAVDANLDLILARLREGATEDQCQAVINAKVGDWGEDKKMSEYLRPATLFNRTKFEQYIGEIASGTSASDQFGGMV